MILPRDKNVKDVIALFLSHQLWEKHIQSEMWSNEHPRNHSRQLSYIGAKARGSEKESFPTDTPRHPPRLRNKPEALSTMRLGNFPHLNFNSDWKNNRCL